jgi:hypothetical protein
MIDIPIAEELIFERLQEWILKARISNGITYAHYNYATKLNSECFQLAVSTALQSNDMSLVYEYLLNLEA